jgi:hypothetical protein
MSKIIEAPNGTFLRAQHIVAVTAIFQSPELGCDAWAVYTVSDQADPFLFCAPEGKNIKARNAETAKLHEAFLFAWGESVEGISRHQNN